MSQTDAPLRNADVIARRLAEAGCRFAFGIPGGEVLTLMDALDRAGLRMVLTKHENAAGFMAEGTFQVTGAPGVLLATLGPGVANAVNVIANAWQDRVPLILLSGCVDAAEALTYTHQVFDHGQLLRPVCKASLTAMAGAVDVAIDKAVAIALDDPPGPVHLDVPIGVAAAPVGGTLRPARPQPSRGGPVAGPALERARAWLAEAERPLLIAGQEVLHHGAERTLARFVHRLAVPLITTYKAKGVVPEDDPLCLGGAGLSPRADRRLKPLLDAADLILLAGYDPIEMRLGWRDPWPADKRVIALSALPDTQYMHTAALTFLGDVGAGLDALLPAENAPSVAHARWPDAAPGHVRTTLRADFASQGRWGPAAVFEAARAALPLHGLATADSGAHRILMSQLWSCPTPRSLLQSTGLCTMGCALPLAIGAKLAAPERPVLAVMGDAGLEMVAGELATARDCVDGLVILVLVDRSLALIGLKQRQSGLKPVGVDFGATDFAAVADAFGGRGVTAETPDAVFEAIRTGLGQPRFTLVAAPIDRLAYDGVL